MTTEPHAEPYVSAEVAAKFLGNINRRFLLALARKGIAGAYPLGTGEFRKKYVFRLSELSEAIARGRHTLKTPPQDLRNDVRFVLGSPR